MRARSKPTASVLATPKTGKAEPSTLPFGIGRLNLVFFILIVADLGSVNGLIAQATGSGDGGVAPMLGVFLGVIYGCYPLQFLDGRAMIALRGYRMLLWALLILHVPLVVLLTLDFRAGMSGALETVFLTAPISIFATPGLYIIARALRSMHWLDPAAPMETWEPMQGIDGPAPPAGNAAPSRPTPIAIALLLPFVAAWRARQPVLAICAALLWAGTFALLAFAPWRALLMFSLAAGIGQRVSASTARTLVAGPATTNGQIDRGKVLQAIFTPARLAPAPVSAAAGLLCLPFLFVVDFKALGAFLALPHYNSVQSLRAALQSHDLILLMLLACIFIPGMLFLPLGTAAAKFAFRALALMLGLGEICLTILYAAISFHIGFHGNTIFVPDVVYPVFWPITLGLLAAVPLALIVCLAVLTYGRVANLLADNSKIVSD